MDNENLMTEAEFDAQLRGWTQKVHSYSVAALKGGTHGSGHLAESMTHYVDHMRDDKGRHIAFRFERYGVFRQYGAGRGWVVVNGVPVPGYRVVSLKDRYDFSAWGEKAQEMLRLGYSRTSIKNAKMKRHTKVNHPRTPLDWLDGNIRKGENEIADIAVQFYGDRIIGTLGLNLLAAQITKSK